MPTASRSCRWAVEMRAVSRLSNPASLMPLFWVFPSTFTRSKRAIQSLCFRGYIMRLPQTGFGTSERRIRENPDEVLKMVRATLRGLMFTWEEKHRDEILDLIMRRLKI